MTSTQTEDLAATLYRALAEWDVAALDDLLTDDFEGTTADGLPLGLGGRYEGPDAMRQQFWRRIGQAFEVRATPASVQRTDDGLVVLGRYSGRARGGGELDAAFCHVLTVRDGRIASLVQTTDTARWHAALRGEDPREGVAATARGGGPREHACLGYEVSDGLARLTLRRPEAGNAFDQSLADALDDVTGRIVDNPAVRAVLVTAEGSSFSVGGDIEVFASAAEGQLGQRMRELTDPFHAALARLAEHDAPVVSAVHGAAAGGGLALVCCADVVIAAETSRFVSAYAGIAMTADGGITWWLPRLVGLRRAQAFMLEGRPWTAAEASEAGLVTKVLPDAEVDAAAEALALRLATGPTVALGHVRRMLRDSDLRSLPDHLAVEQRNLIDVADTADAAEGISAFRERRAPRFIGR
jgi:2-(1,2-epoxy-1,2-dihydrophenyl)acetyl-CoA isomerase